MKLFFNPGYVSNHYYILGVDESFFGLERSFSNQKIVYERILTEHTSNDPACGIFKINLCFDWSEMLIWSYLIVKYLAYGLRKLFRKEYTVDWIRLLFRWYHSVDTGIIQIKGDVTSLLALCALIPCKKY